MRLNRFYRWIAFSYVFYAFIGSVIAYAEPVKDEKRGITVSSGLQVSIEYTLKLDDKTVLDTNIGSEPLTYIQGPLKILPGLEKALDGMRIGESKHVIVKPEDGYGLIDKGAFIEVSKEQLPKEELKIGTNLQAKDNTGRVIYARVSEIKEKTVVLDFNHPLAGKTLYFDVKVLDIQETHEMEM